MQEIKGTICFAASDIVNFFECEHLTALDLINLETPLPQAEDDDGQAKGNVRFLGLCQQKAPFCLCNPPATSNGCH